jgi:hypothetical protein
MISAVHFERVRLVYLSCIIGCASQARVAELWKKIHDLEDSISKGIELHTLQKQLKEAKQQLAVFEVISQ